MEGKIKGVRESKKDIFKQLSILEKRKRELISREIINWKRRKEEVNKRVGAWMEAGRRGVEGG